MNFISIVSATTLLFSVFWLHPAWAATDMPDEIPDELLEQARSSYVFVFNDAVQSGEIRGHARQLTQEVGGHLRHVFSKAIKGFSASVSPEAAAQIASSPHVAYYEPNQIYWAADMERDYRTDDGSRGETQGRGPGRDDDDDGESAQITPWGVGRVGGPIEGFGLHAWIIDTGIDLDHPDLNVGYGANFVTMDLDLSDSPEDDQGHGTHVAGTIGAIDNDIDVVGVAPNAMVHPVKVLSKSGFGLTDWIVAGIDFVAANAAPGDCANMSLGGPGHQESMHNAVLGAAAKGIRFSLAAGNESDDAEDYEPAHIDAENVFTISAIDSNDVFAVFSNWGEPVDFAAPGIGIISTRLGGGMISMNGTSMAAPHVCGILLFQAAPNADGEAINDPDGNPDPIAHY